MSTRIRLVIKHRIMKQLALISMLLGLFQMVPVAQKPVEVKYYLDPGGFYVFFSDNHDFCNYIVIISLPVMRNFKASVTFPFAAEVKPGKYNLFELRPVSGNDFPAVQYTYTWFTGCSKPAVKLDFPYLLPIGAGKEAEVFSCEYVNRNPGDPEPKEWYGIGFNLEAGDTVYAARRGNVIGLRDTTETPAGYDFTRENNTVEIAHDDCSFGVYEALGGIFVRQGCSERIRCHRQTGTPASRLADKINGKHRRLNKRKLQNGKREGKGHLYLDRFKYQI